MALLWAGFTRHVWEDYYITYRASKNLATGQGLTFTAGERVHSFTSPLGVLLPAGASWLTGNRSDTAALWIFRVLAAAALGGAVVLARAGLRPAGAAGPLAGALAAGLLLTDAKILDYTINGMETPFLLLFIAWTCWALFTEPPRAWMHLGLAWAGLMWTRPDGFIYVGALAAGALIFRPGPGRWWQRGAELAAFLRAGALTTGLYLPWLLWAWRYYGTPVPHTITAKGFWMPPLAPAVVLDWLQGFPGRMWSDPSILAGIFMPAYSYNTGWPTAASGVAIGLSLTAMLLWLVPRVRWEARVLSFAALVGQFYLHTFVGFPTPWYLPAVAFLSLLALSLTLAQLAAPANAAGLRWGSRVLAGSLLLGAAVLAAATSWQLRCQQSLIEEGQRRQIGVWLKAQAGSVRETVFLEPLGYIGFYSGLKMLDYPGLSAPEVVASRRRVVSRAYPDCWTELIMDLQPDWVVLRGYEREKIMARDPEVLTRYYQLAKIFDVRAQVAAVAFLPGRGYITNDAYFEVYRRKPGLPSGSRLRPITLVDLTVRECFGQPPADNLYTLRLHAPARIVFPVNRNERWLSGGFGFFDGAYTSPPDATDGAEFEITYVSATGESTTLLKRMLDPLLLPGDRGTQLFRVELPAATAAGRVELTISEGEGGNNNFDWTYYRDLLLETPADRPR
ncbi:MAG: hypothetical protein PSU94_00880 [Lacunisphaera sp.]|nr:hypothetical protein [Lacunisphaera sp.]